MCPLDRRFVAGIVILKEPPDGHGGGLEAIARENGAVPATTLIVDGVPHIVKFFKFLNWFTGQRHAGHGQDVLLEGQLQQACQRRRLETIAWTHDTAVSALAISHSTIRIRS